MDICEEKKQKEALRDALSDVVVALRENIRLTDLVARIGGDEFLVYRTEISDTRAAMAKSGLLLEKFQTITPLPGAFVSGVGFDECRENRLWSPAQAASFRLTANVLANFLVKLRLKEAFWRLRGS